MNQSNPLIYSQCLKHLQTTVFTLSIWTKLDSPKQTVDPDQMPLNAASDQGLRCLPLMQQFLDISISSKIELYNFKDKYGKELMCLKI